VPVPRSRVASALFLLFVTFFAAGCTQTFFQPQRALIATPERAGLRYETVTLRAADGVELFTWFLPARGTPQATVLFLHGNAENISTHFMNVAWMPAEGFNVLALEYRGYGSSGGTPSLAGVQLDIDAALEALLERPEVDRRRIVLFGQSLGAALSGFSEPIAYFLVGVLTLGLAVSRSGLADRLARWSLARSAGRPRRLYAQMLASFPLLTLVLPSATTRTAIMVHVYDQAFSLSAVPTGSPLAKAT